MDLNTAYKELGEVRRQNKELREKLDRIDKTDLVFPSHLSHGSDLFEIEFTVSERSKVKKVVDSGNYNISLDMLFAKLYSETNWNR